MAKHSSDLGLEYMNPCLFVLCFSDNFNSKINSFELRIVEILNVLISKYILVNHHLYISPVPSKKRLILVKKKFLEINNKNKMMNKDKASRNDIGNYGCVWFYYSIS